MVRDTASQDSYISERVKEQLNLRIKDAVNVSIFEFGSEQSENKPYGSLEFYLHTNERKKTFFTAFLKHRISTQLNDFQISCKENYEHLPNWNLAESGEGERNADVLMGSESYWMFSTEKLLKEPDMSLFWIDLESQIGSKITVIFQTSDFAILVSLKNNPKMECVYEISVSASHSF